MFKSKINWCCSAELTSNELTTAVDWLISMDRDFYNLFDLESDKLKVLMSHLLREHESEFSTALFARYEGLLVGFLASFSASELYSRRIFVLKSLLDAAPIPGAVKSRLKNFEGAPYSVPQDSLYLSKIYVSVDMRGAGLADEVISPFLDEGENMGRNLCLHVHGDNSTAIAFYRKHGFKFNNQNNQNKSTYYLMEKNSEKGLINEFS